MEKESETRSLTPVLCGLCANQTSGVMMIGECEVCGEPTSSAAYRYCGKCSAEEGICCQCGDPLDDGE